MPEDQKPHDPDASCYIISIRDLCVITNKLRWRRRPGAVGQVLEQAWQDTSSGGLLWVEVKTVEEV